MKKPSFLLLFSLLSVVLLLPSHRIAAAVVASDSFDYPNGALDSQNGGTGWANAWSGGAARNLVNTPGMEYSDGRYNLTTAGGYVGIGGFHDATFRGLSQTYGTPGTSIYVSCMASAATGADYAGLALFLDDAETFFIGRTFNYWGYFTAAGGGAVSLIDTAAPALLVLRLDFEAEYTVARLYVNPPLGAEPSLSSVRGEWRLQPVTFNRVRIAGGSGGTSAMIDEVVIGETYDDVTPDDTPDTPFITIKQVELDEGDFGTTTASLEVRLNEASASTVTIDYTTSDVSANAGSDYLAATDQVTFDPGQTLKQIDITINGDTDIEITEALRVTLSSAVNALLAETSALVIIANDDWAGPDLIFYEGFGGYPTGVLPGQGPPLGGSTTWSGTPTSVFDNITAIYTQDPRSLAVSDGTVSLGSRNSENFVGLTQSFGSDGQTVYISFLRNEFALDWSGVSLYQGGQELLFFGRGFQQAFTGVFSSNGANPPRVELFYEPPTPAPVVNGMFLVYRLDFRAGFVRVRMFRNPDLAQGEPTVSAIGDLIIPFNGTIDQLRLGSGYSGFTGSAEFDEIRIACTWDVAVPVVNDTPRLSVVDARLIEGDDGQQLMQFVVTASGFVDTTVEYATSDGTAIAGEDYESTSGTLNMVPSSAFGFINVPVNGDRQEEDDETLTLTLSNAVGVLIDDGEATGTILNDDGPAGWLVSNGGQPEGNGGTRTLSFYVALKEEQTEVVSVDWATADGTAVAGSDYVAASGTVTMQPGMIWMPVTVTIIGDSVVEPHEHFLINLSNSSGPLIVSGQSELHIADDDAPRTLGEWTNVANEGDEVPGHLGRFWSDLSSDLVYLNEFQDLAFEAITTDDAGGNPETAIWLHKDGIFSKVVAVGNLATDLLDGFVITAFTDLDVSNSRTVYYAANLESTPSVPAAVPTLASENRINRLPRVQGIPEEMAAVFGYSDSLNTLLYTAQGILQRNANRIQASDSDFAISTPQLTGEMLLTLVVLDSLIRRGEGTYSSRDLVGEGLTQVQVRDKNKNGMALEAIKSGGGFDIFYTDPSTPIFAGGVSALPIPLGQIGVDYLSRQITAVVRMLKTQCGLTFDADALQSAAQIKPAGEGDVTGPIIVKIDPVKTNSVQIIKELGPNEQGYILLDADCDSTVYSLTAEEAGATVFRAILNFNGFEYVLGQTEAGSGNRIGGMTLTPATAALELQEGNKYYIEFILKEDADGETFRLSIPVEADFGRAAFDQRETGSEQVPVWVRETVTGRRSLGLANLGAPPAGPLFDIGDAHSNVFLANHRYPSARHDLRIPGPMLGFIVDAEVDQPFWSDLIAIGDDVDFGQSFSSAGDGNDEDGVIQQGELLPGQNGTVRVTSVSAGGLLSAWVDFDADGDWDPTGEQIIDDYVMKLGQNDISFSIPPAAVLGRVISRFRVSSEASLNPDGDAMDGEVEDHVLMVGPKPKTTSGYHVSNHTLYLTTPFGNMMFLQQVEVDEPGVEVEGFDGNSPIQVPIEMDGNAYLKGTPR